MYSCACIVLKIHHKHRMTRSLRVKLLSNNCSTFSNLFTIGVPHTDLNFVVDVCLKRGSGLDLFKWTFSTLTLANFGLVGVCSLDFSNGRQLPLSLSPLCLALHLPLCSRWRSRPVCPFVPVAVSPCHPVRCSPFRPFSSRLISCLFRPFFPLCFPTANPLCQLPFRPFIIPLRPPPLPFPFAFPLFPSPCLHDTNNFPYVFLFVHVQVGCACQWCSDAGRKVDLRSIQQSNHTPNFTLTVLLMCFCSADVCGRVFLTCVSGSALSPLPSHTQVHSVVCLACCRVFFVFCAVCCICWLFISCLSPPQGLSFPPLFPSPLPSTTLPSSSADRMSAQTCSGWTRLCWASTHS